MAQPFVPLPNTAQVEMIYLADTEPAENVYHVKGTAPWTLATLQTLTQNFIAWELSVMSPNRSTDTALVKVVARDASIQSGVVIENSDTLPIRGTSAGRTLPNNVTVAVAKRTDRGGRSYRGRIYHIGLTGDWIGTNTLLPSAPASLISDYESLLSGALSVNGAQLVVASKRQDKVWLNPGIVTPVTRFTVDNNLDSQRRRLPGHNRHR